MYDRLHNWLNAFFILNKSEQRGIFILIILIISIASFNLFIPFISEANLDKVIVENQEEITAFLTEQQRINDSITKSKNHFSKDNKIDKAIRRLSPFEFNPNNLPVESWKKMGFSDYQIKNIKNYEAAGGKFRSKNDLKKIYTISDKEFIVIEPYIIIPVNESSKKPRKFKAITINKVNSFEKVDINSADKIELQKSLNTPLYISERIISYRDLLGGFVARNQLREVYGLSDSVFNAIDEFIITDTTVVQRIEINSVTFKELLKHPYFDYNTTKAIFKVRDRIGEFSDLNQIKMIEEINDSITTKALKYLYIKQ
jgi:competence protein ComEA